MARIRSVHPGLFTDESFMSCSPAAQILFIGIWTEADDYGAFEWKPITLKARILPAHNVDVVALLAELEAANMVRRYEHSDRKLGAVRNFTRFQRPKKPKSMHVMTPEIRTYVGMAPHDAPPVGNEFGTGGEPDGHEDDDIPPSEERVPKKPEKSPQMEDEGRKERGDRRSTTSLTPPPAPIARRGDAEVEALVAAADAAIAEAFPGGRRGRHREDQSHARGWAERGISPSRLGAIIGAAAARYAERRPADVPTSLKFFAADVDREEPPSPYPEAIRSADERQWYDRVMAWQRAGVWIDTNGPKPDDPGTRVPDAVLAARGMRRRPMAAVPA